MQIIQCICPLDHPWITELVFQTFYFSCLFRYPLNKRSLYRSLAGRGFEMFSEKKLPNRDLFTGFTLNSSNLVLCQWLDERPETLSPLRFEYQDVIELFFCVYIFPVTSFILTDQSELILSRGYTRRLIGLLVLEESSVIRSHVFLRNQPSCSTPWLGPQILWLTTEILCFINVLSMLLGVYRSAGLMIWNVLY